MSTPLSLAVSKGLRAAAHELELMDAAEIAGRYRELGELAYQVLVERFRPQLLAQAKGILARQGDAESAVQEAFSKFHVALAAECERVRCPAGWLSRAVRNEALGQLRGDSRRRRREEEAARSEGDGVRPEETARRAEELEILREEVAKLPEGERRLLRCRYEQRMTLKAIASESSLPVSTVQSRLRRSLDRLEAALRGRGVALGAGGAAAALAGGAKAGLLGHRVWQSVFTKGPVKPFVVGAALVVTAAAVGVTAFGPAGEDPQPVAHSQPAGGDPVPPEKPAAPNWEAHVNSAGVPLVYVPPGRVTWLKGGGGLPGTKRFTFGGFYAGKYELTQAQWQSLMGDSVVPYFSRAGAGRTRIKDYTDEEVGRLPMESLAFADIEKLLKLLNAEHNVLDGREVTWRLPTTDEWEALRRGPASRDQSSSHFYSAAKKGGVVRRSDALTGDTANYNDGSSRPVRPRPVGGFDPSPAGCFDMSGNVYEVTSDRSGDQHVIRGGGYGSPAKSCRAKVSSKWDGKIRQPKIGVRLIAEPVE